MTSGDSQKDKPELTFPELTFEERRQLDYADAWMALGNPVEAERELDQIDPERAKLAEVFSKRFCIYEAAGWIEKRDTLAPNLLRKSVWKCLVRVIQALGGLTRAIVREKIFRRPPRKK